MPDRVMVFIDYENVRRTARDHYAPLDVASEVGHIDPSRVADLLVARRRFASDLVAVHVYRGHPLSRRQPASAAAHSRQVATWSRDRRIAVHLRPLNYLGWPASPPREKGIDVMLALDYFRLALVGAYDVGILFSRDTDLMPAVEAVRDLTNARMEVAAWGGPRTNRLQFPGTNLPWCHFLDQRAFDLVRDDTDYTKP
jgi:uncharacterized LabA/DUF88 family protein